VTRPEPLPDTWYSRDFLVLLEVARRFADDPTTSRVEAGDIADTLGLDHAMVCAIGGTLRDAGFVDGIGVDQVPGLIIFTHLTPTGRREVGMWPSPEVAADRLLAALDAAIANAPTEEAKGKARRVLDAFTSAGRDLLVDVAGGVVTGQISGG